MHDLECRYPVVGVTRNVLMAAAHGAGPIEADVLFAEAPAFACEVRNLARSKSFGEAEYATISAMVAGGSWHRTAEIAVTALTRRLADEVKESDTWSAGHFYRRAVAVGLASRRLAAGQDSKTEQYAFLGGLLQDWGYLALAHGWPGAYDEIAQVLVRTGPHAVSRVDRAYLEIEHDEMGAIFAEFLGLPSSVVEGIAFHHAPGMAPDSARPEADIAHVASWLVGRIGYPSVPGGTNHSLDPSALRRLGWSIDELEREMEPVLSESEPLPIPL